MSTNFEDSDAIFQTISNSKYKIVSEYRINRRGADIAKESGIVIMSKSINYIIRKIMVMDLKTHNMVVKISVIKLFIKRHSKKSS